MEFIVSLMILLDYPMYNFGEELLSKILKCLKRRLRNLVLNTTNCSQQWLQAELTKMWWKKRINIKQRH